MNPAMNKYIVPTIQPHPLHQWDVQEVRAGGGGKETIFQIVIFFVIILQLLERLCWTA